MAIGKNIRWIGKQYNVPYNIEQGYNEYQVGEGDEFSGKKIKKLKNIKWGRKVMWNFIHYCSGDIY